MEDSFTKKELELAKSVDLCEVASSLGYTVKKIGKYHTLKEMDSIRIYGKTNWYRWSRQNEKGSNGGSQIDEKMPSINNEFCNVTLNSIYEDGMDIKEAVFWLLDFAGYKRTESYSTDLTLKHSVKKIAPEKNNIKFVLPQQSENNNFLYSYLQSKRKISKKCIDFFVDKNLIYESKGYHNIVFKGKDENGITRFASMRGVFDKNGYVFKCDVKGNDKNYGFNFVNDKSDELEVFEGAIDLLSYCDIYDDYKTNKLALGMIADAPLETFLKENQNIRIIRLCLDNDGPGRVASSVLKDKYESRGYKVIDLPAPKEYKDYNDWIKSLRSKKTITMEKYR